MLDNISINIKNITLNYENTSALNNTYQMKIKLEEFMLNTTN